MPAKRHPLAEALHALHQRRNATAEELRATLEMAQLEVEKHWDQAGPGFNAADARCALPGCNYRRYPVSRFCMYHATGKDTFAARLQRAERKSA
jgi:hypothetical protein